MLIQGDGLIKMELTKEKLDWKKTTIEIAENFNLYRKYCTTIYLGMMGFGIICFAFGLFLGEISFFWIPLIIGLIIDIPLIIRKLRLEKKINKNVIKINNKKKCQN